MSSVERLSSSLMLKRVSFTGKVVPFLGRGAFIGISTHCTLSKEQSLPKGSPPRSPKRSTLGWVGVEDDGAGEVTAAEGVAVGVVGGAVQVLIMGWAAAAAVEAWGLEVADVCCCC